MNKDLAMLVREEPEIILSVSIWFVGLYNVELHQNIEEDFRGKLQTLKIFLC